MHVTVTVGSLHAVSWEIRNILTERAINFNIALDDVSITILSFGNSLFGFDQPEGMGIDRRHGSSTISLKQA